MNHLVKSTAGRALDVALFGVGLAEGIARGVYGRVRAMTGSGSSTIPEQRVRPVPTVPTVPSRPTPDPYDVEVETPVGTTGAGPGYNPSTAEADLQQPGTEPIMDPATTKSVKAETDHLRKAAERNPES
jgi:hypothetical protein